MLSNNEMTVKIKGDSTEAERAIERFTNGLERIGPAAERQMQSLTQLSGALGELTRLLGLAGGAFILDQKLREDEQRRRDASVNRVGDVPMDLRWGADTVKAVQWMGHQAGMKTDEVQAVGGTISRDLDAQRGLAAFGRYSELQAKGIGGPGVTKAISGLMKMGYSADQAQNLAFLGFKQFDQEVGGLPGSLQLGRTLKFSDQDVLALTSLVDAEGGSVQDAQALMGTLAGKNEIGNRFVNRVGKNSTLRQRVAALPGFVKTDEDARALGGRSLAFLGALSKDASRIGEFGAEWSEALDPEEHLIQGYQPNPKIREALNTKWWAALKEQAEGQTMGEAAGSFKTKADADRMYEAANRMEQAIHTMVDSQREIPRLQLGGG